MDFVKMGVLSYTQYAQYIFYTHTYIKMMTYALNKEHYMFKIIPGNQVQGSNVLEPL